MILDSAGRLEACRGCRPEIPQNLEVGGSRKEVGGRQREVGSRPQNLEVGGFRKEVGGWQREVGGRRRELKAGGEAFGCVILGSGGRLDV